jgi:predicted HTH domain antitoxin
MKVTRSVRLSEETLKGVTWLRKHEGGDASDVIRRMIRRGLEREMVDLYRQGRVSLREMADVLSISVREALDLLWRQGVHGNVTMAQALEAMEVGRKLSGP